MIRFLIQRPIAVIMVFTAFFILGLAGYYALPVSLLPDIPIPEITVQVSAPDRSAREVENTVVKTIRQQLLQVSHLKNIESETRDGSGLIRLKFKFGTNPHLSFIEVNEKIDLSMPYLPKETDRPRVIQASASDIPVFYLSLTLKNDSAYSPTDRTAFFEMCQYAEGTVRRRIEQLPEVAMADLTGLWEQQIQIVPDLAKMESMDLHLSDLESALHTNNVEPGSMRVKDGYYEYNIRFSTTLRTVQDIETIFLKKNERLFTLKDIAKVEIVPEKVKGVSLYNGKRSVNLAIIKRSDANMDQLKHSLQGALNHLSGMNPDIEFHLTRSETELLDSTISNLQHSLVIGLLLICLITLFFLKDLRSPLIIGINLLVSLVISFLFFYLFHRSLNIISLAGLIVALGMMIDSSIIVIENISQYREKGYTLHRACIAGTHEIITPTLCSILTTIAVFLPLVFLSGIAGALFFDQAFAVTVGLIVSYLTGIILLPVLYALFYHRNHAYRNTYSPSFSHLLRLKRNPDKSPQKRHNSGMYSFYEQGIDFVFRHKISASLFCLFSLCLCVGMFWVIEKSGMPKVSQRELIAQIDWNEYIHPYENQRRVHELFQQTEKRVIEQSAEIGQQDYLLNTTSPLNSTEAFLYYKTQKPAQIDTLRALLSTHLKEKYPHALLTFSPSMNLFERLFTTGEADLVAEVHSTSRQPDASELYSLARQFEKISEVPVQSPPFDNQLNLTIDQEKVLLYQVSHSELYRVLRTSFKENRIGTLRSFQHYLPVYISGDEKNVEEIMQETLIQTEYQDSYGSRIYVPLREFIRITPSQDLKIIRAGKNGEYIPYHFWNPKDPAKVIQKIYNDIHTQTDLEVAFSGTYFSNREMIREMIQVLLISVLLMYFILAAQFESFLQPLIVLIEIPIDIGFSLLLLWLLGQSLNVMSAIGIVITCGIIINDSILKLDAINDLRKQGFPLMQAIHQGGRRRLRPIIMTTLTTVLAMAPLLFFPDMGSELQKPLCLSLITALSVGTLVSLFIVPYIYWLIYPKKTNCI